MVSPATPSRRKRKLLASTPISVATAGVMIFIAITALITRNEMISAEVAQVEEHVLTTLSITHEAMSSWIHHQHEMAAAWAEAGTINQITEGLLAINLTREELRASPQHAEMLDLLATPLLAGVYSSYDLIDLDGVVLSSSRASRIGTEWRDPDQGDAAEYSWIHDSRAEMLITPSQQDFAVEQDTDSVRISFTHPVKAADGAMIASIAFTVDPAADLQAILQRGDFGATGETFVFDATGRLITASRFTDQLRTIGLIEDGESTILNVSLRDPGVNLLADGEGAWPIDERPLTLLASEALAGRPGSNVDGYRDYRGVDVIGAWVWNEELGLGFGTEIDCSEAFAISSLITRSIVLFTLAIEILILAAGVLFARFRRAQKVRIATASEFQSLTEAAIDAIVSADSTGRILSWNPAAEAMFGFTPQEAIGMNLRTMIPERFRDSFSDGLRRILEGTQHEPAGTSELLGLRRDGTEFPIEFTLNAWNSEGGQIHAAIVRDISERVRLDQERLKDREQLSDLLESKSQLIASVSHELRTPLTSIVGFTDLLLHERESLSPEDLEETIRTVASESSDLAGIVEDLLVAARTNLEEVPMNLECVDLASAAKSMIDRLSVLPLGSQIPVAGGAKAYADPSRVRQILRNLVSNAVRHGGDTIHVEIVGDGRWTTLSVCDDGEAIPASETKLIFEPFGMAASEHRHSQSIGLGLSVSRRLAELMGGSLTYRHQQGESIFELNLPNWSSAAHPDDTADQGPTRGATHPECLDRSEPVRP